MILVKWRFIHDFEKEERWLNAMCAQGWAMKSFFLCRYVFEPCTPGEYTYRLELLEGNQQQSHGYLTFLEDMGIVCIECWHRWAYLRKKTADGTFELFSEKRDRIKHYQRIFMFFLPLVLINMTLLLIRTVEWGFHWHRLGWNAAYSMYSESLFLWLLQFAVTMMFVIICALWAHRARRLRKQLNLWE